MKERPILFSGPMVRAILEGKKTQTRRVITSRYVADLDTANHSYFEVLYQRNPNAKTTDDFIVRTPRGVFSWMDSDDSFASRQAFVTCPFGMPGDRLWVRETFIAESKQTVHYRADGWEYGDEAKWKPSIFMPRSASRITLEVTKVRVERLQDCSEADAIAEGASPWKFGDAQCLTSGERGADSPFRSGYAVLWDEINADRGFSWKSNPWVWVIEFKRLEVRQ